MYVVKEHHTLKSGCKTFKWTWWYKDEKGIKTPKQKVIHSKHDLDNDWRIFKEKYPNGEVRFRNFAK